MGVPEPALAKTRVLCRYSYVGWDPEDGKSYVYEDAVVVEVQSSDEIEAAFGRAVKARRRTFEPGFHVGARPSQWELLSYWPENGLSHF